MNNSIVTKNAAEKENQKSFNKLKIINTLISFLKLWYKNSDSFLYIKRMT
jgi:hypothetical protein